MLKRLYYIIIVTFLLWTFSCQKEYSYEGGKSSSAIGTLQDSTGNCQKIMINGNYIKDSALSKDNFVTAFVNITKGGRYVIYSDTVNGYWFKDSGTVFNTGSQSFTLQGYGKPISTNFSLFTLHFNNISDCNFNIPLGQAVFSFDAPAGNCPLIKVNGTYTVNEVLNFGDTINVPVKVSIPGTYNVRTLAINGMVFSATGVFNSAGNMTLTLSGNGTPYTVMNTEIPVNIGGQTCTFTIPVISRNIDTTQFWKFTAEGINYKGYVDSIFPNISTLVGHPLDTIHSIEFMGIFPDSLTATHSLVFQFALGRINHDIITGLYHPALVADLKDFYGDIYYASSITGISYNIADSLHTFTINLDTYDLNTRLVHCTFSGPVLNASGQTVNITNGEVKAYLAH